MLHDACGLAQRAAGGGPLTTAGWQEHKKQYPIHIFCPTYRDSLAANGLALVEAQPQVLENLMHVTATVFTTKETKVDAPRGAGRPLVIPLSDAGGNDSSWRQQTQVALEYPRCLWGYDPIIILQVPSPFLERLMPYSYCQQCTWPGTHASLPIYAHIPAVH